MTPTEVAEKCAEEVFRTVERERSFIKRQIAEAIEKVLLSSQITPEYGVSFVAERRAALDAFHALYSKYSGMALD